MDLCLEFLEEKSLSGGEAILRGGFEDTLSHHRLRRSLLALRTQSRQAKISTVNR
jgi:hypothetical protein